MLIAVQYAVSALALILVATYYLLASIPFAYYHFLQFPHFWWLPIFITFHPVVFAVALALVLPRSRAVAEPLRRWIRYVTVAGVTTTACMAAVGFAPVLLTLEITATLAFLPLAFLTAASAITICAATSGDNETTPVAPDAGAVCGVAAIAGLLIGVAYAAESAARGAAQTLGRTEFAIAAGISVAAHTFSFAAAAVIVVSARRLSRRWANRSVESAAVALCAAVGVAVLVRRSLLTALILSDARAALVALAVGLAIVSATWAANSRTARSARPRRDYSAVVALTALGVLIVVLPRMIVLADWGGTLQKILVVLAWLAAVTFVACTSSGIRRTAVAVVVVFAAASTAIAARHASPGAPEQRPLDLTLAVDRYATFDASVGVLLDVFHPMVSEGNFFSTLRAAGDATDDRSLAAVPLTIADVHRRSAVRPPNIFIVVVDSLRPDYLSAYNAAATFTPAIGAFAKESIVMRRAFTQYAGTALSQPALWAGGLIPRAMYVKPFAAVDNLERLTVAAGYRRYISVDEILSTILEDWSDVTRLDTHLAHPDRIDEMFKFDLCRTAPDLIDRLDRDGAARPIFFYSQPQSVHIRVIADKASQRKERVTVAGTTFFKPAVDALTSLDGCFGRLIVDLKARGLYDDSIVVLTSDHGDAYGEAGRWGHAWYMAPEILRIPLIMHVPDKYLQSREVNRDEIALLSDLTPTLYDLLGYPPIDTAGISGRSLVPTSASRMTPRDMVLVQSSYSRTYGLLDANAKWLYVGDANHAREQFFDIAAGDPFGRSVDNVERPKYRKWLLERMARLEQFYSGPRQH